MANKVIVKVPATSANLGPGFDILGIAVKLYNTVEASFVQGRSAENTPFIEIEGEGSSELPRDTKNIVWRSMQRAFELTARKTGKKARAATAENVRLRLSNAIPLSSGLGSSAAARLGGIIAANELSGRKLSSREMLSLATVLEGHPDNVVPAMLGGLCVTSFERKKLEYIQLPCPSLSVVVCTPDFELPTEKARKVLPHSVPFRTAVSNSSKLAILISSFVTGRYDMLGSAMQDQLHQPYREKLIPGMKKVFEAAMKAGAYGAALSGAGPSLMALCAPAEAGAVGSRMQHAWNQQRISCRRFVLEVDCRGAVIK